jgi:hypothetical protein
MGIGSKNGEMPELAEGARLLSEYPLKIGSRVRIPLSPPAYADGSAGGPEGYRLIVESSDVFASA